MLESYLRNAGFPYAEIYQSCNSNRCDYVDIVIERREYEEKGSMKESAMLDELEGLKERVRVLENWLIGLGYPKSELYIELTDNTQVIRVRDGKC